MAETVKINDVALYGGTISGTEKIPMDNGDGSAYTLNTAQIAAYAVSRADIPSKVSELDNDAGYVKSESLATINGISLDSGANFSLASKEDVPSTTLTVKITDTDGTSKNYIFYNK